MPRSNDRSGLAERFGHVAVTGLGVVLAVTPVALWIAWTATLVVCIMLAAIISAVLFVLLTELLLPSAQDQGEREAAGGKVVLPDEFIDEVQRLYPLTYHHSRLETTRFRRAMARLSRLIEDSGTGNVPR